MASLSKRQLVVGGALLILILFMGWAYGSKTQQIFLPLAEGDTVSSWHFTGAYADNPELVAKAQEEIKELTSLIGNSKEFTDYQLYVQIAAQYELLGDGEKAYDFLNRALAIDPVHTGLAWANLGTLMERLGAFHTGRIAYAKAVEAQSSVMGYHSARLTFLIAHFAEDTVAVEGAFSEATTQFGTSPQILQIKAQWLTTVGRTADAIAAWKQVRSLVTGGVQPSIDKEIARLEAKL